MTPFIVTNKTTGEIVRHGSTGPHSLLAQYNPATEVLHLIDEPLDLSLYDAVWENGVLVKTPKE